MGDQMTDLRGELELLKQVWMLWLAGGAVSAIVGLWLLLNPETTIGILVVLFGIGFVFNGLADLALARDHPLPVLSYALSILFVVAGIVIIFNRSVGASTLALVVGVSILLTGIGDLLVGFLARERIEHWTYVVFLGGVGVLVGIMSITWPDVTLVVVAALVGVRLLVSGMVHMGIGLRLRQAVSG